MVIMTRTRTRTRVGVRIRDRDDEEDHDAHELGDALDDDCRAVDVDAGGCG